MSTDRARRLSQFFGGEQLLGFLPERLAVVDSVCDDAKREGDGARTRLGLLFGVDEHARRPRSVGPP